MQLPLVSLGGPLPKIASYVSAYSVSTVLLPHNYNAFSLQELNLTVNLVSSTSSAASALCSSNLRSLLSHEAAQATVCGDDPMTRDEWGKWILSERVPYRPWRGGEKSAYIAVRGHFAGRYLSISAHVQGRSRNLPVGSYHRLSIESS